MQRFAPTRFRSANRGIIPAQSQSGEMWMRQWPKRVEPAQQLDRLGAQRRRQGPANPPRRACPCDSRARPRGSARYFASFAASSSARSGDAAALGRPHAGGAAGRRSAHGHRKHREYEQDLHRRRLRRGRAPGRRAPRRPRRGGARRPAPARGDQPAREDDQRAEPDPGHERRDEHAERDRGCSRRGRRRPCGEAPRRAAAARSASGSERACSKTASPRARSPERSGLGRDHRPEVAPQPGVEADLAGRLALEVARHRARGAGRSAGSSCARAGA